MTLKHRIRDALPARVYPYALRAYHAYRFSKLKLLAALRLQQREFGRTPDLVQPLLFNEKVLWRMLYDRRPLLQLCSDRLAVRDYVAARVGEEYLIPLLGVFDRPEDIPWADLDPPYVVKATHGCGWNIFVREAGEVDPDRFGRMLEEWLRTNYYHVHWEWSYRRVPRRIMVERFIGLDGRVPEDFKVYCFDGEPRAVAECLDRFTPAYRWSWHDPSWTLLNFLTTFQHPEESVPIPPPARLADMIELARVLSRDFDHVRVDLYPVGDRVYFGELTTTPSAGSSPFADAGEAWLGAFWHLPSRAEVRRVRRHPWKRSDTV